MSLLDWTGEEKFPRNCACISLTINHCNINPGEKYIAGDGTIVITHYYANEWTYRWSISGNECTVCNEVMKTYRKFVGQVDVDLAIAHFIIQKIVAFMKEHKAATQISDSQV